MVAAADGEVDAKEFRAFAKMLETTASTPDSLIGQVVRHWPDETFGRRWLELLRVMAKSTGRRAAPTKRGRVFA